MHLSELSKEEHELAKKYYEQNDLVAQNELNVVEDEIDKTVAKLFGINDGDEEEIRIIQRMLNGDTVVILWPSGGKETQKT